MPAALKEYKLTPATLLTSTFMLVPVKVPILMESACALLRTTLPSCISRLVTTFLSSPSAYQVAPLAKLRLVSALSKVLTAPTNSDSAPLKPTFTAPFSAKISP